MGGPDGSSDGNVLQSVRHAIDGVLESSPSVSYGIGAVVAAVGAPDGLSDGNVLQSVLHAIDGVLEPHPSTSVKPTSALPSRAYIECPLRIE